MAANTTSALIYRDSEGNETPLAGLAPVGNLVPSASLVQSGSKTVSIAADDYINEQITLDTPMPDSDYIINFETNATGSILFTVMVKTENYFAVNIRNLNSLEINTTFIWTAVKPITNTQIALDEEKIDQLDKAANDLQLIYSGASYLTTSDLITQLTSDIVARKHSNGTVGGNISITWTGKSCITGSYSIHDSGAGFVVLDFENNQDGKNHCTYSISNGSAVYIAWSKLATTDDILDNNHNGAFMVGTIAWFKTGTLFNYPNAGGFYSSTFLMSDRDGAWTGILKLADDGAGSVTATIVSLGASPRGGNEFYYDETSYCLYFCGSWDRITITQLTGKKVTLSIISTTQEEAKQNTKIVPINVATTTLPTLNGTCSGLADSECYATFDVTFDSWGGSSPTIIGIAADGAYVNSKALIMVNNSIQNSDKKVRILYADGVNCLFRVYAEAPSLYSNTVKVYVAFYTSDTSTYSFKVQQRDYIGAISNLVVTNDSSGMPNSSWFQAVAQPTTPVLTTDLTSSVTSGSNAPITSGGVYSMLNGIEGANYRVVIPTPFHYSVARYTITLYTTTGYVCYDAYIRQDPYLANNYLMVTKEIEFSGTKPTPTFSISPSGNNLEIIVENVSNISSYYMSK